MAELPANVTVKTEEALPAAPASYDGPGPLNEPPETVAQAAPPPPPADETQAADEQTPQVAQQTPVAMTPEQAAAAYAAQPDVQAAYAAAAAAYAAQPPQHYPQPQEVNRRLGQCDLGVPRFCGAFTPSMRLVSIRRGRGWSLFRFWGRSDRVYSAQVDPRRRSLCGEGRGII